MSQSLCTSSSVEVSPQQRTHRYALHLQPKSKLYKVSFGQGLMLQVMPTGKKYWRKKYIYNKKERTLALGVFPAVSLKHARAELAKANARLEQGIDPDLERRINKLKNKHAATNTFEGVALEWLEKEKDGWAPSHVKKQTALFKNNLLPFIGSLPIKMIEPLVLLDCLRKIEHRGALESARRTKQIAGQIFRYAIITGRATEDPSIHLQGAMKTLLISSSAAAC